MTRGGPGAKQEGIWQRPWRMKTRVLVLFGVFLAERGEKPITKLEIKLPSVSPVRPVAQPSVSDSLPYDPAIPPLGASPKKNENTNSRKDACAPAQFRAAHVSVHQQMYGRKYGAYTQWSTALKRI